MEVGQVGFHSNKEVTNLDLLMPLFTFLLLLKGLSHGILSYFEHQKK